MEFHILPSYVKNCVHSIIIDQFSKLFLFFWVMPAASLYGCVSLWPHLMVMSRQLLDCLPFKFVQTFMFHRGMLPNDFGDPLTFPVVPP